jgi:hypothetical protein
MYIYYNYLYSALSICKAYVRIFAFFRVKTDMSEEPREDMLRPHTFSYYSLFRMVGSAWMCVLFIYLFVRYSKKMYTAWSLFFFFSVCLVRSNFGRQTKWRNCRRFCLIVIFPDPMFTSWELPTKTIAFKKCIQLASTTIIINPRHQAGGTERPTKYIYIKSSSSSLKLGSSNMSKSTR